MNVTIQVASNKFCQSVISDTLIPPMTFISSNNYFDQDSNEINLSLIINRY